MSSDLQWLLLRNNNSFIVKRVPEGPIFSKEPGNLRNLHSYKYSGLANSKTIDISAKPGSSTLHITTRKPSASPHQVRTSRHHSTIRSGSGPRRAARVATGIIKRGYRPDLRTSALARVSALLATQKEPAPTKEKKTRGAKAKKASTIMSSITIEISLNPPESVNAPQTASGDPLPKTTTFTFPIDSSMDHYTGLQHAIQEAKQATGEHLTQWRDAVGDAEKSKDVKAEGADEEEDQGETE